MDRSDILAQADEVLAHFSPAPGTAKSYVLRTSSGTTGAPIVLPIEKALNPILIKWFGDDMPTLVCYGARGTRMYNLLGMSKIAEGRKRVLVLDNKNISPGIARLIDDFAPECIVGFPSFILKVSEHFSHVARAVVRELHVAGEMLTPAVLKIFSTTFPNARVASTYVCSEAGSIAFSCSHLPPNQYHPKFDVSIVIESPDDEGIGEIVLSAQANGIQFSGYHPGDLGRLHNVACPCGKSLALEVLGRRGHDFIKLLGATLRREEFDRAISLFANLIDDYRVEASTVADGEVLRGRIFLKTHTNGLLPSPALQQEFAARFAAEVFVTPTRTIAGLVAEGVLLPLEVEFSSEPFAQKHKDIKLQQIS